MTTKSASKKLFDHASDMEPLLPEIDAGLANLTLALIRSAERLGTALHPITRKSVAGLVRSMNSYYSNLIEGHRTTPRDIDAALTKNFSRNQAQRSLQILHLAHMEVQADMDTQRIVSASPRTGQKITGELLSQRLVTSASLKGPLRLDFPAEAAGYYFPNLYPAGAN